MLLNVFFKHENKSRFTKKETSIKDEEEKSAMRIVLSSIFPKRNWYSKMQSGEKKKLCLSANIVHLLLQSSVEHL